MSGGAFSWSVGVVSPGLGDVDVVGVGPAPPSPTAGVWQRFRRVARGQLERADNAANLRAEHLAPLSLRVRTTSRDFR